VQVQGGCWEFRNIVTRVDMPRSPLHTGMTRAQG